MRKLLVMIGFAFAVSNAIGQKLEKLDDVKEKISKGKYDEAKEKLDKVFENPQANSNADALFYRAQVYQNLAKTKQDSALYAEAFGSMQKYLQLEQGKPENQRALQSTLENHKTLFDIYQTYFARGVEDFKGNKYSTAFYNFRNALNAFDMMKNNNITTVKFDTTVTLYAGYSAQNAQLYSEASKYYDQIINNNIKDTSYVGIYRFMINNSLENKDTATAKKYLGISEERFPMYKEVWLDYHTFFLPTQKPGRFDEYEKLVKANPDNETLSMNYAIELYNYLRSSDAAEKDVALRARSEEALKNVLAKNPSSTTANLLISQFYWTELYQLQSDLDAVRGTTPQATAKKKEINTQMDAVFDKVFPYLTKSYDLYSAETTMKPQDKANYRIVLGQLSDYYTRKKQPAKAAEYQAKAKSLQ